MAATSKRRKLEEQDKEAIHHHWPEDVIKEILVKPPIKSILRFKSTCKAWYSVIRSRSFIDIQRRIHHQDDHRNQLLFSPSTINGTRESYVISSFSPSPNPSHTLDLGVLPGELTRLKIRQPGKTKIVDAKLDYVLGPLNSGIFCVMAHGFVEKISILPDVGYDKHGCCNVAFCNPATREFKLLAPFRFGTRQYHYGFGSVQRATKGHSDIVVDYKMVALTQRGSRRFLANVYSLRRGSWKSIFCSNYKFRRWARFVNDHGELQFPTITQDSDLSPQAFLNGSCHWIARLPDTKDKHLVLHFDMANEVFGLIPGPWAYFACKC